MLSQDIVGSYGHCSILGMIAVRVIVSGKVQGVFFRESTRRFAESLGVTGWVKNLGDGRVEAIFEGEAAKVLQAVQFVRHGPPHSRVTSVEEENREYSGQFTRFEVK